MNSSDDRTVMACSLNDAEFRQRRALVRRTLVPRIVASRRTLNGLILTFANSESMRADLETLVGLERQCCGFLAFSISASDADPDALLDLHIEGPPEAASTIEMFTRTSCGAA